MSESTEYRQGFADGFAEGKSAGLTEALNYAKIVLDSRPGKVPIESLKFEDNLCKELKREGIRTVHDLVSKTEEDLAMIHHFNLFALDQIIQKLAEAGYGLRRK